MTEMTPETNTTHKSEPSPTPKPSNAKVDAKAYRRKYYRETLRGENQRQHNDKLLGSVQSIRKHEANNLLCKIKRLEDTIKENNINK